MGGGNWRGRRHEEREKRCVGARISKDGDAEGKIEPGSRGGFGSDVFESSGREQSRGGGGGGGAGISEVVGESKGTRKESRKRCIGQVEVAGNRPVVRAAGHSIGEGKKSVEGEESGCGGEENGEGSGEVLKLRDVGVGEESRGGLGQNRRVRQPRSEGLGWVGVPG